MSDKLLHHALLRPAVLQILRAAGFQGAKPSVVDTLTDITSRYIMLLAARTIAHAHANHIDPVPDITDVRMALVDCGLLQPTQTASEEVWRELLRKPIDDVPERNSLRRKETQKRDNEDTHEIKDFIEWFHGPTHKEIMRIAGLLPEENQMQTMDGAEPQKPDDYFTALKKKHSKTGEESRFQGTVLGRETEAHSVKIDGPPGMPESIQQWQEQIKARSQKLATIREGNGYNTTSSIEAEDAVMTG